MVHFAFKMMKFADCQMFLTPVRFYMKMKILQHKMKPFCHQKMVISAVPGTLARHAGKQNDGRLVRIALHLPTFIIILCILFTNFV